MCGRASVAVGRVLAFVLSCAWLCGCRVAVTDCISASQAEESAWQLRRAGISAASERCGRKQLVSVPRWEAASARGAIAELGLPRQRLEVPAPDVGLWPSPEDRARLARHEAGARAAALIRGLPLVEDAWVELEREGSTDVATATVVMREGSADWVAVERAVRGMNGFSTLRRFDRIGATLPRLNPELRWAKVGPFRIDARQAGLFRWSIVGLLLLMCFVSGLMAFAVRRGQR